MYTKISGSREGVLAQTGHSGNSRMSYRKAMDVIFKDLIRIPFTPTNGKTYSDYVQAWMQADVVSDYRQGTPEGSIEAYPLSIYGLQQDPPQGKENFATAYFNDNSKPCGVGITWLRDNPTILSGAVIRDTPASNRLMTQLVPTFLVKNKKPANTLDNMEENFLPLLESKEMVERLKGFTNNTGAVNEEKLQQLEENATVSDKSTLEAKRKRFKLIGKYFDEQLNAKRIPEIESYKSVYLAQSTKLNDVKTGIGHGILEETTQPFYTRNRNALGLLTLGVLVPLSLFTFGAPLIALALSIVVSSLFIIAPSAIFLRTKETAISTYKSAQLALAKAETPEQHIDKLFEGLCRPLLLQEADAMTDKQVRKYIDDAIEGKDPTIPRANPMRPLVTTLPKSASAEPTLVTTTIVTPPAYSDGEKDTIDVPFKPK